MVVGQELRIKKVGKVSFTATFIDCLRTRQADQVVTLGAWSGMAQ